MLAENISAYLKKNGIRQSHVAARVGIHQQTFSNIMTGKRQLTAEEYVQICSALGKPATYFVDKAS